MMDCPFVTIILPVRNEETFIERGIRAIFAQDYPGNCMEILVADGMSTDSTRAIVQGFTLLYPERAIQVVDNPGKIVPTGMNFALRQARGKIIIRVDGHTLIASDYVRQCVDALQRTHADNVGGRMNAIGLNPFGRAVALATSTPFGVGGGRFHYSEEEEWVDTVYMGAWSRRVFEEIGIFDEELVRDQDDELNYRLQEYGGKILLNPRIRSEYVVRSTPKALWSQYYQYGFYKVRVMQKHPRQMRPRQFIPPAFVFSLLVSFLLMLFTSWGWILFVLVAGGYLLANMAVSVVTVSRKGWKHFPMLPLCFAILHVSYGLGFLAGLVKFWNRWGDRKGQVPAISNFGNTLKDS